MNQGWQTKPLGEVLEVQNGYAFNSKAFNSSKGMPLIRIRDLKGGTETETRLNGEFDKKYVVRAGDLLIGMDGEFGCYEWKGSPALLNQRVCRLQNFDSKLLPRFLYHGVNSYLKEIEDVTGFTTVKHLSSKQILGIDFPLPPLPEQQRIVGILDEAFEGIASAKANAEKNLENAYALIQPMFISILNSFDHKDWHASTVEAAAGTEKGSIRTGPFGSQLLHSEFVDEGIPVLGIDNAVQNRFAWSERRYITPQKFSELSRYRVKPGDVLITIMGTCGRCAIVPDDIPTAINTKHLCCITLNHQKCLPEFLHAYFLYHPIAQEFLFKKAKGAIMAGLNMGLIKELPLLLPPVEQQRIVAKKVIDVRTSAENLEAIYGRKLAALEALKKSLLHQAFAGKL